MVTESAGELKGFLRKVIKKECWLLMVMRLALAFTHHRGRMSCSQASGMIGSEPVYRGELTRFLVRPGWKKPDFNDSFRKAMLAKESGRGTFILILDATLVSQAGKKTANSYSTGHRGRNRQKGRRYNKYKIVPKKCHSFTFGLLLTPSGIRIPMQIPHYTKEYCQEHGIKHRTTAEAAAEMIRQLPLPKKAEMVVLGDTAYEATVVRKACEEKGFTWIFPANPERVYEGPTGKRPQLRSRLKDWNGLSLTTLRLRASTGKYARYRRLSKWRVGPKLKPRVYYAYQEKCAVRSVGNVRLIFSTKKAKLKKATPDDVKILMTNATDLSMRELIDLYTLRWQIELFFKELKSTLGFSQYSFHDFEAVKGWVEIAITTVLFLEHQRAQRLRDRRLRKKERQWWEAQRLHGLCAAFRQECEANELLYLAGRLKSFGGITKLKQLLAAAIPLEYRITA